MKKLFSRGAGPAISVVVHVAIFVVLIKVLVLFTASPVEELPARKLILTRISTSILPDAGVPQIFPWL